MIFFKATEEQLLEILGRACKASIAVGIGVYHYNSEDTFPPEYFKRKVEGKLITLDYIKGRMVKLTIEKLKAPYYASNSWPLREDYQSWITTYPDNSLIEKSGATVVTMEEAGY